MEKTNRICRRGWVSGVVQGVGFRAFVQGEAIAAGLDGYARNLADGRVEVLLCGHPAAVATVESRVAEGPRAARVEEVLWEDRKADHISGFSRT